MKPSYLYRNSRSGDSLELFLVAAISSLLVTRFLLFLSGYPSIGGGHLHIAHMLYGGIFLTIALILTLSFIGSRVQRLASIIGGIGFGLFIDELGKFITRDNNYFFQPTISLIYFVFIVLFLLFRSLSRERYLSKDENLLNALQLTEEAVIREMDTDERKRILSLLHKSDQSHPLVAAIRAGLHEIKPLPEDQLSILEVTRRRISGFYSRFVSTRFGITLIELIFVSKALIFVVIIGGDTLSVIRDFGYNHLAYAAISSFISSSIAALLIVVGVFMIRSSRERAYNFFSKALLIDIFVTQFFTFYRAQFDALPGFILNILLYIGLQVLIRQERRLKSA